MIDEIVRFVIYLSIFVGVAAYVYYLLGFLERKDSKSEKPKKIYSASVIIPAYNEEDTLEKTVESVVNLDYPKDKIEVLIIDDGSKDKTLDIARRLERKYSNLRVFTKKNGGKGSALNFGIKKAKGELVISLDSDSFVASDALKKMIPYFNDPKVMCVTSAMKVYKPKGFLQRIQATEYDLGIFLRKSFSKIDAVHVTPGPFSVYRKEFFIKHGGYDEKNVTEDMEIAMRIQSLNYRIENCDEAIVYTVAPKKFVDLMRQRRRWYYGTIYNWKLYRRLFSPKYGDLGLIVFPLSVFSVAVIIIVASYYFFKGIERGLKEASFYYSIGFDFINNWAFKYDLITLNIYRTITDNIVLFGLLFTVFSFALILAVNIKAKSARNPTSIFLNYLFFLSFYSFYYAFWWIVSIIYSMTHKEIKW